MAAARRRRTSVSPKQNPPLVIFNPKRNGVPGATFTHDVKAIVYRHGETGELMVHAFGPRGEAIELESARGSLTIRGLPTGKTNACAIAVADGSIVLRNANGLPLWQRF